MWLLIPAVVLLYMSVVLTSFYTLSLNKPKWEGPAMLMGGGEIVLIVTNIVVSLIGATILFIAVGWKWWLIGLGIYWAFVVLIAIPLMSRILRSSRERLLSVIGWPLMFVIWLSYLRR